MVKDEIIKGMPICKRCGRKLKTPEAIERGMGRVCWEKSRTSEIKSPLFRQGENTDATCGT